MADHSTPAGPLSITTRLTAVLLLVSLLPMVVVAYFNLSGSTSSVSAAEQKNLKLLAGSLAGQLDQLIAGVHGTVNLVALAPDVAAYLGDDPATARTHAAAVDELLARVVKGSPNTAAAYLMDRAGVFVAATNPKVVGKDFSYRDYFQGPIQGEDFASDLLVGTTSGESGVYFSRPVRGPGGAVVGVAVVKLRGEAVVDILDEVNRDGGHTQAFLVNPEGVIIHHPDPALRYRSLDTLPPADQQAIQARKRFPVAAIESLTLPQVKAAMVDSRQAGWLRYLGTARGPVVLGYAPMANHYWAVGVEKSEASFAEPLNRLFHQVLYSVALVGALVVAIALVLSKAMVRPIRALTEATQVIGKAPAEGEADADSAAFRLNARYKRELERIAGRRRDEIGLLARTFSEMEERLQTYVVELTAVTAAKERIESEMKIAARIQKSFLPEPFALGERRRAVELHAVIEPAKEVGGDLYDYFFLDERRLLFAIGDVSDKGIPAGLFMGVTLALLRNIAAGENTPSRILAELNHALCVKNDACQFVTMFCGVLDLSTGVLHYTHAGHNPPYIVAPGRGVLQPLVPVTGTALGVFDDDTYQTQLLELQPGDRLFLYTDGVTEAMDVAQALYGEARLEACLRAVAAGDPPRTVVERVMADVASHAAGAAQSDDITAMCIEYRPG